MVILSRSGVSRKYCGNMPTKLVSLKRYIPICFGILLLPTCWMAARIYALSRNYWGMRIFRRPRYTRTSVKARLGKSIFPLIPWRGKRTKRIRVKMNSRLERLREALSEKNLEGMFISQPDNRFYLSGFYGSAGYLLITSKDTLLATDFRYLEQVKMQAPDYTLFRITAGASEWFPKLTGETGVKTLGFESGD